MADTSGMPDLPDLAEMRTRLARLRQDTQVIRAEAEAARDAVRAQAEQSRAEREQALAALHRAARDGELGGAGRRLAERVAEGDARWVDVLHERDPSPDAASLRRDAGRAVGALVDRLAEDDPDLARRTGRHTGGSGDDQST